jgi:nucleotide-binding universal stress UspA family protein
MKRFKNILYLSNPKVKEKAAIRRAVSLAKQNDARVTVLSVVNSSAYTLHAPVPDVELDSFQVQLVHEHQVEAKMVADGFSGEGVDVRTKTVVGVAFIEVIREVLREQHDLVILAADSKQGVISRLFGSLSTHLMRKCPCPVWVVKPVSGKSYRRILAAVDIFSDPSDEAEGSINSLILQLSSSLAQMDKSELHMIQVWNLANEGWLGGPGGMNDKAFRRLCDETEDDLGGRLEHLMQTVDLEGIGTVRTHLKRGGDPAESIVKLARKQEIDLLVMGTVCRTGLAGFLIGNTAEEVLGAVDCSVLTVKPEGFVSPVTLDGQ